MAGPPTNVAPDELFLKLLERPAPADVISWPGKGEDFQIRIEVLRKAQIDDCRVKAQRWWDTGAGKALEQQGLLSREIVADRVAGEILAQAVTRVEPIPGTEDRGCPRYPRLFRNADDVAAALLPDELEVLWKAYQLAQYKFGPWEESIQTVEERNAWVAKLATGSGASPLLALPLPHLLQQTAVLAAERYVLCAVMSGLLPLLPESWASAVMNLHFGIGSSTSGVARLTDQRGLIINGLEVDGLEIDDPDKDVLEEAIPEPDKSYIDVRQIAIDIVKDDRLATMTDDE